tara:strand:+ start:669 stop:2408 length:1740 start_codon:yes stop_codon:yes gene_type:complete
MKLGRIGGNSDRTDWGGVYTPSENVQKMKKIGNLENYVWRNNYAVNTPFYSISQPGISYGDNDSKIYISDGNIPRSNTKVKQYNLTTPGDPSTALDASKEVSVLGNNTASYLRTAFSYDGTRMYVSFYSGGSTIYVPPEQYNLSTAWDVSTAVPKVKRFYVGTQETNPFGLYIKPDGTKMYIIGTTGDDVNEYNLSTAYDVSTASYVQNFSISAQEVSPTGVEFKPDGTKMYIVGYTGDDINEYDLSTAWDVSTASYSQNFSVSAQETLPHSLRFKPDGTKMYVTGYTGDDVNEYNLSTAWDISTASYVQQFATGDTTQVSVAFCADGTKMYTGGLTNDYIKEFDLSTAWDISTASYVQNSGTLVSNPYDLQLLNDNQLYILEVTTDSIINYTLDTDKNIRTIDGIAQADDELSGGNYDLLGGLAISSDGTKFFVLDRDNKDRITEFTLPTPYELKGAVRTGNFLNIEPGTNESLPVAMHFSEDGSKIYIGGLDNTRAIYLYTLSTAWDVTTATLQKQRINLYSSPYTSSTKYDVNLTEAEFYGTGPISDVEGLAVSKDGTSILMAHNVHYTEFRLAAS